jgi:DNA modification methylase
MADGIVNDWVNAIHFGDCRDSLRAMAAAGVKVQTCVTSPPYFGLRDYGHEGQIGLEETPEQFIAELVDVFRCVREVLADDGTLWVNIGDSYATGTKADRQQSTNPGVGANRPEAQNSVARIGTPAGCKTKDLIGIPWMLAFALRADGWYLRQDIIWHKPNPMPESVTDRCTKAHEYLFLLSKSPRYFYDAEAVKEPAVGEPPMPRMTMHGGIKAAITQGGGRESSMLGTPADGKRNRRSVWSVATKPYNGKKALTDYVGDDGKPYTASPDCPIHAHLSRVKKSGTRGYDAQPSSTLTSNPDTGENRAPSPACDETATTFHKSAGVHVCNAPTNKVENTHASKTALLQTEHISGAGTQIGIACKSEHGEHQGCEVDSSPLCNASTATTHSTQTSKTGLAPATTLPCTPCAGTAPDTQHTEAQRGSFVPHHGKDESNTSMADFFGHPSQDTAGGIAGIPSRQASSAHPQCLCNEVIIDHFAVFPPDLIVPCILAGSRPDDVVLDPFMGSGTTAEVSILHGREFVGCELNPDYKPLQDERIAEARATLAEAQAAADLASRQADLFTTQANTEPA